MQTIFRAILWLFLIAFVLGAYNVGVKVYHKLTFQPPPPEPREEIVIRVIEGWDLRDIAAHLAQKGLANQKEFYDFVGTPAKQSRPKYQKSDLMKSYPFLKEIPDGLSLEGYIFPDTHRVYADASIEEIVDRLLSNFDDKISDKLRDEIKKQNKTLYEILTMASVIEREVNTNGDRAKVSDILWSRMRVGMPLQVDSSVNYVTEKNDAAITKKDSRIESPYNTYRFKGLPVGPISNPGLKSIKAAIYPEITPYTYFLTDKEGNVHYARTLDEHNENKYKYLK
ncbi:MAG: hypothetical protein CMI52_04895 [Parcubacteria group bacterium]|mgnify:CR=1 FL=1|nr:hypothetical protein [Parcubacteria group bacterium]